MTANSVHSSTSVSKKQIDLSSLIGPAPTFSVLLSKPRFFCTHCHEIGKSKVIKTKQDWIRHEEDFHEESGLEWNCKACNNVFFRGVDFKKHVKRTHKNVGLEGGKVVVQHQRLYACGFERCRELNYSYEDFINHVAIHMSKGHSDWNYNRIIRNLLKHSLLSKPWKTVCKSMGPLYGTTHKELKWDRIATEKIRQQLECFDFGDSFSEFLKDLFVAGASSPHAEPNVVVCEEEREGLIEA